MKKIEKKSLYDFKNKKTNIRKVEKISSRNNKKNQKEDNLDRILFEDFEEKFIDLLNSKVEIKKNNETYRVTIDCFSIEEIENLYWRLKNGKE